MRIVPSNLSPLLLFMPDAQNQHDWFAVAKSPDKPPRPSARKRKKLQALAEQMALPFQLDAHQLPAVQQVANPQTSAANSASMASGSRLRVVRELDSAISPSCAGRMVISGRIADVCAELDRLSRA